MSGWRPRAPLQEAARTPPVGALRPAQPPAARAEPAGGCCNRGSSSRSYTSPARCRWCARSCRPSSSAGGRIRARHARALSSASCSPTSGAPTADDFVRRDGGYGSASPSPQARLNLHRAVGAVRPDPIAGIGEIEHIVQLLTVVHGRARRIPFADHLMRLVHAEGVLVAEEARIVLLRPARVLVLLGILGGLLLPSLRRLAGPDRLVLLLRVALPGHRHNRGVNNLAAARNIALSLKMLAEALKQLVDQPGLRQRLTKQPDRGGIRHRVLELQIEKAHERYAVADQVLSPIVREIVERL